jgi:tripeptidyl-peptidase-1
MGPETGSAETVCQSQRSGVITSGGGFSTKISRPSWQTDAINFYFTQATGTAAPEPGYDTDGRGMYFLIFILFLFVIFYSFLCLGFPDISFIGVNYQVVINGNTVPVFGTSASAPVFAAFITLVNSVRLHNNMSTIGFINPTLYAVGYNYTLGLNNTYGASLNDVTSGNTKCCAASSSVSTVCCTTGFTAVKGW